MDLLIDNKAFFEVNKISNVKTFLKRLGDYKVVNGQLEGKILVDVDYYDISMVENFTTCMLDFKVLVPSEYEVESVNLRDLNIEVIDNQGINCIYQLQLFVNEKVEDKEVQYESKSEENVAIGKEEIVENEEIKQEIQEEYDQKLMDSLEERNDNKVEIISTSSSNDERGFLSFFDSFPSNYAKTKTIRVNDASELNKLSVEYNIALEELYKGYDEVRKTVIIKNATK